MKTWVRNLVTFPGAVAKALGEVPIAGIRRIRGIPSDEGRQADALLARRKRELDQLTVQMLLDKGKRKREQEAYERRLAEFRQKRIDERRRVAEAEQAGRIQAWGTRQRLLQANPDMTMGEIRARQAESDQWWEQERRDRDTKHFQNLDTIMAPQETTDEDLYSAHEATADSAAQATMAQQRQGVITKGRSWEETLDDSAAKKAGDEALKRFYEQERLRQIAARRRSPITGF